MVAEPEGEAQEEGVLLCLFAKAPHLGQVKTRMQTVLDAVQAQQLHLDLLRYCLENLKPATAVRLVLMASEPHPQLIALAREFEVPVSFQRGQDLGERMATAVREGLRQHSAVILVGADCPFVDADYIALALKSLQSVPVVFGPAEDGGYVLLGARQVPTGLFYDLPWGGDQVLALSRQRLKEQGVPWRELPVLPDIDRPGDLQRLAGLGALDHWSLQG